MRQLLCAAAFLAFTSALVVADNCDGRIPQSNKCNNGNIPPIHYEGTSCQGDLPDTSPCQHAIAFNVDLFECSTPDPASQLYTTLCVNDLFQQVECTRVKTCYAEQKSKKVGDKTVYYNNCSDHDQQPTITKTWKKCQPGCNPIDPRPKNG